MTSTSELAQESIRYSPGPMDASAYTHVGRLSLFEPEGERSGFLGIAPSGRSISIGDGPETSGPSPMELVLLGLGACTGMDVISILRKKRQKVRDYRVNVYANKAEDHPKVWTTFVVEHVVTGVGVDPKAVERSIELSATKYCSVSAMLVKSAPVEHVYRVVEAD